MSNQFNSSESTKPYDFVPIAGPFRAETVGHEQIQGGEYNTGKLTYQIEALTPLFVAGGSYVVGGYTDAPVARDFYRVNHQPAIPGSSLKGVARSVVEAISPSCVTVTRQDPRLIPHGTGQSCRADQACPACSIFGRMSRMAKVRFTDARLVKGKLQLYRLPALYSPRVQQGEKIYQDKGRFRGRKFYFHGQPGEDDRQPPVEVAPPKSLFWGEFQFENLSNAELGLLLLALGFDASFALKLGGGKPTCLGSIRVQPGELTLIGRVDFLQAEPERQPYTGEAMVEVMIKKIRAAYRKKFILAEQLEKLREIWRYPNDRHCPDGMY